MIALAGFVAVAGFAAYRVWRLVAVDTITAPLRDRMLVAGSDGTDWRAWVAELLACPWCSGWWIAGVVDLAGWVASGAAWPGPVVAAGVWAATSTVVGTVAVLVDD